MRKILSNWRTWVVGAASAHGWYLLLTGHWALASVAFCAATWAQLVCKK